MTELIDLRSDTVTRPSAGMRAAIAKADVGDDVFGDDPTVLLLQEKVAALFGKEAAIFVPTGTMANQISIGSHLGAGDELICDSHSHVVDYEGAGVGALWGAQCAQIESASGRGIFSVAELKKRLRAPGHHDDPMAPRQKLVIVENTHNRGGGAVWPIDQLEAVFAAARAANMTGHLDGARIWNAHIQSGVPLARMAAAADTISVCLSKGLGAPAGSLVVTSTSRIPILKRLRKRLGGGMRQAGILAAAGIYALDHNLERLAEDHANARFLAERLDELPGFSTNPQSVATNMVFAQIDRPGGAKALAEAAKKEGVLFAATAANTVRMVTHLDVTRAQLEMAVARIARAAAGL
jgi:threonine aldolase